jgi:heme-degrading monooxygenase HmoA
MAEAYLGFYDLDAAPARGLTGEFATRLGDVTEAPGFIDGSLYVSSAAGGMAIVLQYDGTENWMREGLPGVLLYAADWRSRSSDGRRYRHVRSIAGDGNDANDSSFYVIQRFETQPDLQTKFTESLASYLERFAAPIHGFLSADIFTSLDGTSTTLIMPWAHEAAINALENADGSLEAMQTHLRLTTRHTYESYQRVSYLRASRDGAASPERTAARTNRMSV